MVGDGARDSAGDRGGAGYPAADRTGVGARDRLEMRLGKGEGIGMRQDLKM